ncbi:MAG: phosphodiester glycosidase family protein [Oscillospiraceae bacterium]|nr:phosphodiester glycosidase family protein [Oscillospiraceae bacterium]
MSKKNLTPESGAEETAKQAVKQPKKKKKKGSGLLGRIIRRFFLLLLTVVLLVFAALVLVLNLVFNGPSIAAQEKLTMTLIEASATKWVPALFIGDERVAEIRKSVDQELPQEVSSPTKVVIQKGSAINTNSDEWANDPDGIRIEHISGETYNAHVMIVRDPSRVYMGTSTEKFSTAIPGKRITEVMNENPDVVAAINAGAFNDDGTAGSHVGSTPLGLVMSNSKCVWTSGSQPGLEGFAGFTEDNILVVSQKNLSKAKAEELKIRDGCCFGPALIMDGDINQEAYNNKSGYNPRTAIGQRADGAVIFVCIDGRQTSSLGGTYADVINIMVEYGAINACNMDGGSSSVMMYRDTTGKLGTAGEVSMINNYSLLQSEPRRMPNFWLVREAD